MKKVQQMVETTKQALKLWALQLVPSLLPFMIITNLFLSLASQVFKIKSPKLDLICYKFTGTSLYGCCIFIFGQLCGYPLGAKLIADGYHQKKINLPEANYLMSIVNQSSPAFLKYYVGGYALSYSTKGIKLCILFFLATIVTSLITRNIYLYAHLNPKEDTLSSDKIRQSAQKLTCHFSQILDQCIINSIQTITRVGGYILLFSLISEIILKFTFLSKKIIYLLASSIEISNGLYILKNHMISDYYYPYLIIILTGFGGFCTMAQIKGMLVGTSLSIKPYILGKIIYTTILLLLYSLSVQINII